MRSVFLSATALAASLSLPAHAQAATALDELVVTATRLPAPLELVTGARVVERAEIEARQAVFATDVLATLPGVAVARSGQGGVAAVRLRGAGPDKTLVLIDGVPANDPSDPSGAYDFGHLQLADVERLEVLLGPQSSLWGSEAIGGVVAITRRELDGWRFDLEGGSFGTARGFAGVGEATERYALGATLAAFRADGISKADARDGASEADAYESVSAGVNGRLALGERLTVDGRLSVRDSEVELDGYPAPDFLLGDTDDRARSRAWSGFARARLQALGFTHALSLSAYDLTRESLSAFPATYRADRQVWRWTAARGEALVLGVEHQESQADLDGRERADLGSTAAFAVARADLGERIAVMASLRHDDPERFDGRTTGRLAAAFDLGAGLALTASAGQGFKAPTLSQIVCDFCFPAGPALDLTPETAEGYDLRLGWRSPDGRIDAALTGYRLTVEDQIAYVGGRYVNIARTRSEGLEAEASLALGAGWTARLAYAWTDAIDVDAGASLLRVPDHAAAASLFWTGERWSGAFTLRGESSQSDTGRDGFTRVRRDGFVVADLAGAYALSDKVSVTARVENLADEAYQETFGYGEPGRGVFVGLRLRN